MPKTIKVRVCVVVNERGDYNACGWSGAEDKYLKGTTTDGLDQVEGLRERISYIDADVPLPETTDEPITGVVTDDEQG